MKYLEQTNCREYTHPAVGKTVLRKSGEKDTIKQVINSGLGKIAVLESIAPRGLLLSHCRIIDT